MNISNLLSPQTLIPPVYLPPHSSTHPFYQQFSYITGKTICFHPRLSALLRKTVTSLQRQSFCICIGTSVSQEPFTTYNPLLFAVSSTFPSSFHASQHFLFWFGFFAIFFFPFLKLVHINYKRDLIIMFPYMHRMDFDQMQPHSSVDGHLDWSYSLSLMNSTAINMSEQVSIVCRIKSFRYMPRSRLTGSKVSSTFSFLRNIHTE
jgi:hypothetical protein